MDKLIDKSKIRVIERLVVRLSRHGARPKAGLLLTRPSRWYRKGIAALHNIFKTDKTKRTVLHRSIVGGAWAG